jgi:hypothetical protein
MSGTRPLLSLPSSQDACAAIGDVFLVGGIVGPAHELTLEEVRAERPRASSTAWRMPYSMYLRGAAGASLPQGLYWISHPSFGRMCLFLVPRSREPRTGSMRYEAVFD